MRLRVLVYSIPALAWSFSGTCAVSVAPPAAVAYNRQIRPILSENCFFCHGPDSRKRKAKLRLDIGEEAIARGAFVPGNPEKSELVRRIFTAKEDDVMPPPAAHRTLTEAQKELLRRWIAAGAVYEPHWAYQKPEKPAVPGNSNPIDTLIQKRLAEVHLAPSAEADRRTLGRRVYFDLLGLPPKPEDLDSFLGD